MLARRTPGRTGFEWQRFDCPKCNHELLREVAYADPEGLWDGRIKDITAHRG